MKLRFAAALAAAAVLLAPVALAQTGGADQEAIAKRLVAAAGIHEGDLVMVWGGTRDFALLEDIAIQTRARGAFPLVTLWSQKMAHDMYAKVPARFDSQAPALTLKLADAITALISVDADIDPRASTTTSRPRAGRRRQRPASTSTRSCCPARSVSSTWAAACSRTRATQCSMGSRNRSSPGCSGRLSLPTPHRCRRPAPLSRPPWGRAASSTSPTLTARTSRCGSKAGRPS